MPQRQRHTETWQTATREYLHVADLPLQPWEGWAYVLWCCPPGTDPAGPSEAGFPQHSTMAGRAGQLGMTPRKTHNHTSRMIHCNHGCLATQTRMDQFNFGCSCGNWRFRGKRKMPPTMLENRQMLAPLQNQMYHQRLDT